MAPAEQLLLDRVHAALGAILEEPDGRLRVVSYGEPSAEYASARESCGLADLYDRAILEVTGATRQKFLQGLLSNEVASLQPGQGRAAALLTPKGGIVALLRVLADARALQLETTADRLGELQRLLEHYRVAAPVRFAPATTKLMALVGPGAAGVLAAVGASAPPDAFESHVDSEVAGHATRVVRAGDLPGGGFVLHATANIAPAVWAALQQSGARPIGRAALDTLRVEELRPWYGDDIDESNLLHETGLLRELHSPAKGCYIGQEVVARLEGRGGKVNKALRGLRLSAAVAGGALITAEGRPVGRVTTAASSPRLGPIAMGFVHRSHFADGTPVLAGGVAASVVESFRGAGA
jgi:tRNA-modifying protein YgfZ